MTLLEHFKDPQIKSYGKRGLKNEQYKYERTLSNKASI